MKKENVIFLVIIAVILSSTLSAGIAIRITGNHYLAQIEDGYLISESAYEEYENVLDTFEDLYYIKNFLLTNYYKEIDSDILMEGAKRGMVDSIDDPYTVYLDERELESLYESTSGSFGGIGIIVQIDEDGFVTVVNPIANTPGFNAGLEQGDQIVEVEGEDVIGDLEKAVGLMRGEPDTDVNLTIRKESTNELVNLDITRDIIRVDSVESKVLDNNIGYIKIMQFNNNTDDEFEKHLSDLENQNVDGLILDLRDNPGGTLYSTIRIADRILDEQVIVYTEDRHGNREEIKSSKNHFDKPLVVLVNRWSASASEILTGAVQDGNRGTIVGETTFGKALVQGIQEIDYKDIGIKYTVSQYFTPNGNYINEKGIEPDIKIEFDREEYLKTGYDNQLEGAIKIIEEKIN